MNDSQPEPSSKPQRLRGIYLLPNLFTTTALFAGFYSIVAAMKGYYDTAAFAIFIAMIMDTLDGRVARLTHTETAFGAEYDSLSDVIAFGLAPSLIAYSWALTHLGKIGWLIAFLYVATAALRLARFNTQSSTGMSKRFFKGLPSPAAAGVVAGMVGIGHQMDIQGPIIHIFVGIVVTMMALLMVSRFAYYSFKDIDFKGKIPFLTLVGLLLIFMAISLDPVKIVFMILVTYALSGPAFDIARRYRLYRRRRSK